MKKTIFFKTLLVAACLCLGSMSAWADVIETVGTEGTGDAWASRKYSTAYALAPGETYHFTFTNTSYGSNNWNNWLLDCKATADTSEDDWYFTMRSDNYGWGTSYDATMRSCNFVWADFKTVMNGATVDMYINYNSTDKIIRTYATITKSETEWFYNFASKPINAEQVYLLLSEELAVLTVTAAEKVAKVPDGSYTLYKRTTTSTDCGEQWKDDDKNNIWSVSSSSEYLTYSIDNGLYLANTSANANFKSAYSSTKALIPMPNAVVSVTASATMGVASGRTSSYDYLSIGGVSLRVSPQGGASNSCIAQVYIDGIAQGEAVSATRNVSYTFNVEINQATGDVTYSVSGGATISETSTTTSTKITNVILGHSRGGSESYNTNMKLTAIDISEEIKTIAYADYTVHFQDNNGVTVKESEVRSGEVGSKVNANSVDKTTFYNGDNKYVYSNDGDGVEVLSNGSAAFTITYTKITKETYNINAQSGGSTIMENMLTGTAFLDGSTTVSWSKYIKVESQWYVADESTYRAAITSATTNISYTPTDDIDYFFEFEDLSKSASFAATQDGEALSNNNSARFGKSGIAWTTAIASGTYTLNMYCFGTNAKSESLSIYYCDTDGSNPVFIGTTTKCKANDWELKETTDIVIPDGKALCLYNTDASNNSNCLIDYFTLKRTGDATVSKTITAAAGWATYCSPYALDFSSSIANLTKAYIVTGATGSTLDLEEITGKVPANTGILLEGEGKVVIPVAASADAVVGNKLVGKTAEYALAAEAGYVLMGSPKVGFYLNSYDFTVGANTAYLPANFAGARAFFGFDDEETTALTLVNSEKRIVNSDYFDLQGRRVAQPTKGLYIVNGRKIVIK